MAKPGPRPNARCPKDIHFKPSENHKAILNLMGSGGVAAKLQALIEKEGLRQFPNDKTILRLRWSILRKEIKESLVLLQIIRQKMIESGYTDEDIMKFEEEDQ